MGVRRVSLSLVDISRYAGWLFHDPWLLMQLSVGRGMTLGFNLQHIGGPTFCFSPVVYDEVNILIIFSGVGVVWLEGLFGCGDL